MFFLIYWIIVMRSSHCIYRILTFARIWNLKFYIMNVYRIHPNRDYDRCMVFKMSEVEIKNKARSKPSRELYMLK